MLPTTTTARTYVPKPSEHDKQRIERPQTISKQFQANERGGEVRKFAESQYRWSEHTRVSNERGEREREIIIDKAVDDIYVNTSTVKYSSNEDSHSEEIIQGVIG